MTRPHDQYQHNAATPVDGEDERRRFTATVTRLRSEVEHLRRALQHRAVIEQAKGMLAERSGRTPDDAFATLTTLSQKYNVKLVQLAATVVGAHVPPPSAPAAGRAPLDPELAATLRAELTAAGPVVPPIPHVRPALPDTAEDRARFQLLTARLLAACSPADLLSGLVAELAWPPAPRTAYLYVLEPDGALRLLAGHGVSARALSEWRRIPPGLDLPFTVTSRYGVPLFIENEQEGLRRFPQLGALPGVPAPTFCTLPLTRDGRGIGVLGLTWDGPRDLSDTDRGYLLGAADLLARRLDGLTRDDPAVARRAPRSAADAVHPDASETASPLLVQLDTMFNPTVLLTPIRIDGEVVDFRFDYCNAATVDVAGRPGTDLLGRTLLELYPSFATDGFFEAYRSVLLTGQTAQFDGVRLRAGVDGGREDVRYDIRVARLWDGLMLTWRTAPAPDQALLDVMIRAEDATGSGAFSYDVVAGELVCSPGVYRVLGWAGDRGTLRVRDLPGLVTEADRQAARDAAALALAGQPVTVEVGIEAGPAGRWVTVTGRPVRDATGHLLRIDGKVRTGAGHRNAGPRPEVPRPARPAES